MKEDMNHKEMPQELHLGFMKRAEQLNKQRVHKLVTTNKRNKLTAFMLTAFVGSVYLYTMIAVKQETFLDEITAIDESKVVTSEQ